MQRIYDDLGITIEPGPGPDTTDDQVSFALPGSTQQAIIHNDLQHQPAGIQTCATSLGLKKSGKLDFTVITLPQPGTAAAVFSQSRCPSYAALRNRACLANGTLQALAINSGNSNIFTPNGIEDLKRISELLEAEFNIAADHTLISQTGVMCVPLPMAPFESGIPALSRTLRDHNLEGAAEAIMTSDISPKVASLEIDGLVLTGIAKGAGMVEPNMATILVYFFTNAQVDATFLKQTLVDAVEISFNRLSIDAATSPGDTVAIVSTGTHPLASLQKRQFSQALTALSVKLARDIVSQGEGVTKTLEVTVDSDSSLAYSQRVAKQIINSPLVKTAAHGSIPEWGRIVAAIGKAAPDPADSMLSPDKIKITLQTQTVYDRGQPVTPERSTLGQALRQSSVIDIHVTIGVGGHLGRAWGCDLSAEYVHLNSAS